MMEEAREKGKEEAPKTVFTDLYLWSVVQAGK